MTTRIDSPARGKEWVDLQQTTTRWGAEGYATVWGWEHGPVEGGLIFTYTDVNGLPAEVYGP